MADYAANDFAHIKRKMDERHEEERRALNGEEETIVITREQGIVWGGVDWSVIKRPPPDHGDHRDGMIWDGIDFIWRTPEDFHNTEQSRPYADEPLAKFNENLSYAMAQKELMKLMKFQILANRFLNSRIASCAEDEEEEDEGTYWTKGEYEK